MNMRFLPSATYTSLGDECVPAIFDGRIYRSGDYATELVAARRRNYSYLDSRANIRKVIGPAEVTASPIVMGFLFCNGF